MSDEGFVHDLLLPDSNTRRFHAGDACQWSPPLEGGEVSPAVAAMIAAHRAEIHAPGARPRGRFGLDEDGNPIETSYLGVGMDPETGALVPLDNDGNPILPSGSASEPVQAQPAPPVTTTAPPPTTTTAPKPTTSTTSSTSS
jgi:hypothetical protein